MNTVVAAFERGDQRESIVATAAAVATIVGANVREVDLTAEGHLSGSVGRVLAELADPEAVLAVLPWATSIDDLAWQVLQQVHKPTIVTPTDRPPGRISRALIPLDGTPESAAAVAETIRLLAQAGVDLIVLHVFNATTVPRFWDHPEHAEPAWQKEFLARYCDQPGAHVELRSGVAGDHVLDLAATENVDLIAVGWSQRLDQGHARTLRRTLSDANVPVLVVPILAPIDATPQGRTTS